MSSSIAAEIATLAFDERGLAPCIVQDWRTGEVLTLAYMNREALDRTLAHLALRARLPSGSFVFLVSDFLSFPADDVLAEAVGRRWRLVPVVVQDPLWERSFPDVAGTLLPVADPESGRVRCVRLTRREVRARRRLHEARWDEALERFEGLGLDPVVVDSHEALPILESFREWADRAGAGGGRL